MQVSGTRKFVANLGNYGEKYEASRTVTFSHQDLGFSDEEWLEHVKQVGTDEAYEALSDEVMEAVNDEIQGELEEANALRDPSEDSFILRIPKFSTDKKNRSRRSR